MSMKKTLLVSSLALLALAFSSFYVIKDSNGKAGYTGSPGENTCGASGCHSGGTSASKGVTITATPSFSLNQYYPDSVYTVSVTIGAAGFNRFGFACEVLDNSTINSGTITAAGSGAKIVSLSRKNVTHTTPKVSTNNQATFTFTWMAPPTSSGDAIFYVCANAVNGNGNTSGDMPIPYSYTVSEGAAPTPTGVGIPKVNASPASDVMVFPNPSNGLTSLSYTLKKSTFVSAELLDLSGKTVKMLYAENQLPGQHAHLLDLTQVAPGVYFIKASADGEKIAQKLITVN